MVAVVAAAGAEVVAEEGVEMAAVAAVAARVGKAAWDREATVRVTVVVAAKGLARAGAVPASTL